MRYLQLMYTYAPAWGFGGPSRLLYDYARWMARTDAGAQVIAGDIHHDYSANPVREEVLDGIRIRRVRVYFGHLVKRALNCVSPAMLWLAARFVRQRPDVTAVHIAEFRSPVFLYACLLRRWWPHHVVLVHSAFGMLHEKPSRMRSLFDPVFMGFMIRSVDLGLAQNDHEADAYRALCARHGASGTRVALLPLHTPGPAGGVGDAAKRLSLRRKYDVPSDALVCIFLGRIHAEKGILRTIDAFQVFARSHPGPALLLVVGRDDGFQEAVERHIAANGLGECVRVVNNVYQERFDYYLLSDIFLGFPTIHEETMLSSVEALSCGTPVIVSREADIPFVEDAGAGYVIDFTIETAVERMRRIGAAGEMARQSARAVALTHFMADSACAEFQRTIETVAGERAARNA